MKLASQITILLMLAVAFPNEGKSQSPDSGDAWLEDSSSPRVSNWVEEKNRSTIEAISKFEEFDNMLQRSEAISRRLNESLNTDEIWSGVIFKDRIFKAERKATGRSTIFAYRLNDLSSGSDLKIDDYLYQGIDSAFETVEILTCAPSSSRRMLRYSSSNGEYLFKEFDFSRLKFPNDGFILPSGPHRDVKWLDDNTLIIGWNDSDDGADNLSKLRMKTKWSVIRRGQSSDVAPDLEDQGGIAIEGWASNARNPFTLGWRYRQDRSKSFFSLVDGKWSSIDLPDTQIFGTAQCGDSLYFALRSNWSYNGKIFHEKDIVYLKIKDISQGRIIPSLQSLKEPKGSSSFFRVRGGCFAISNHGVAAKLYYKGDREPNFSAVRMPESYSMHFLSSATMDGAAIVSVESPGDPKKVFRVIGHRPTLLDSTRAINEEKPSIKIRSLTRYALSDDGTKIPYTIFFRPDIRPASKGQIPTIVTGYGGFGAPPSFDYDPNVKALWLDKGGALVVATLRGGGEFRNWRTKGPERHKVYEDMAAVLRSLSSSGWTQPGNLGVWGHSNGGLLAAVMATQNSRLIGASVSAAPVLDIVRKENIENFSREYGDSGDKDNIAFLQKTSPFNNISKDLESVMPMFIVSSDDRNVFPSDSRRFSYRLSEKNIPSLYYEFSDGAHGIVDNRGHNFLYYALVFSYFWSRLGA